MRYILILFPLLFSLNCTFGQVECFDTKPVKQKKLVYDYANILSAQEETALENKLVGYNDITGSQILIVAVNEIYCDISMSAINLGEDWGVGQKGNNNGIVFLIAKENRKIFIATGNGIEEYVPDILAHRIIENTIKPNFRRADYYTGLNKATDIIQELLTGAYEAPPEGNESERIPFIYILIIIFVFYMLFFRDNDNHHEDYSRGGRNKYGRGRYGRGGPIFIPPLGGGGSFGGGFGSGGGFGGFGGGSFGGGGAGGSW